MAQRQRGEEKHWSFKFPERREAIIRHMIRLAEISAGIARPRHFQYAWRTREDVFSVKSLAEVYKKACWKRMNTRRRLRAKSHKPFLTFLIHSPVHHKSPLYKVTRAFFSRQLSQTAVCRPHTPYVVLLEKGWGSPAV